MHESGLASGLIRQIESLAREHHAAQVTCVHLTVGALAPYSADHLRGHMEIASRGTLVEGARLDIHLGENARDPRAQQVSLDEIEIKS